MREQDYLVSTNEFASLDELADATVKWFRRYRPMHRFVNASAKWANKEKTKAIVYCGDSGHVHELVLRENPEISYADATFYAWYLVNEREKVRRKRNTIIEIQENIEIDQGDEIIILEKGDKIRILDKNR